MSHSEALFRGYRNSGISPPKVLTWAVMPSYTYLRRAPKGPHAIDSALGPSLFKVWFEQIFLEIAEYIYR